MNKLRILSVLLVLFFSIYSCGEDEVSTAINNDNSDYILSSTNKIVKSLPNPSYVTHWLNMPDVKFDANILSPVKNANHYETNYSMAINLGVYSADLIYSTFYEHKQITIKYISAVKILAEGLGISNFIEQSDIVKLEENVYEIDSVKVLVDRIFLSSNKILNDNNRPEIALLVEVGAWVESMYISMQLSKQSNSINKVLVEQLSSQYNTLSAIIKALKKFSHIKQINSIYFCMKEIHNIYDKIFRKTGKNPKITPELFMSLYDEVNDVRKRYITSYYRIK